MNKDKPKRSLFTLIGFLSQSAIQWTQNNKIEKGCFKSMRTPFDVSYTFNVKIYGTITCLISE